MNQATILYIYGWFIIVLAVLMLLPLAWAGHATEAQGFFFGSCIAGFFGGSLIIASQGVRRLEINRPEIFILIIIVWITLPLFAGVPFYYSGEFSAINAYFEAVSGFTTTGATVLADPEQAPRSILVWRALLQWAGGFTTLVMIGGLLAPSGVLSADATLQLNIVRQEADDGFRRLQLTARALLAPYVILTVLCIALTWLGGIPAFDAFCLSLSTISTGGFSTVSGSIASFQAPLSEMVLLIFMIAGAYSFICHEKILRGDLRGYWENEEGIFQIILVITSGFILMFFFQNAMANYGLPDWVEAARNGFFMAASLLSTTGYYNGEMQFSFAFPAFFLVALTLIGGASLSTAGGLKVVRILAMIKQGRGEMMQLAFPHAIIINRIGGRMVTSDMMASIWAHLVALILALVVLSLLISWSDIEFLPALVAATSALSNTGPLLDIIQPTSLHEGSAFDVFSPTVKLMLSLGMVVGRLEFLSFFSVLTILLHRA
ncbi:MAG: potassium transporter TrkG [Parvularculales bacterium]